MQPEGRKGERRKEKGEKEKRRKGEKEKRRKGGGSKREAQETKELINALLFVFVVVIVSPQ